MKMLQAKIRGLGTTMESDWFKLSPRLNLLHFTDRTQATNFLRALQTINPPYSCHAVRPFSGFPNVSRHRGYLQRISPKKRTVSMAVFGATPRLVNELGSISELLYQTDQIEVGRRLDYSRWINFVELASSTRWSEISSDIEHLLDQTDRIAPHLAAELRSLMENVSPSDRIKQELNKSLLQWLEAARRELGASLEERIDTTREAVMRADYFQAARATVSQRLPIFLTLGSSPLSQSVDDLLQWMSAQAPRISDKPLTLDHLFLDTLNHQLSLLRGISPPLRIECIRGFLSMPGTDTDDTRQKQSAAEEALGEMRRIIFLAIAFGRTLYHTEPILLFDSPENLFSEISHPELVQFICLISETCQCLYASPRLDIFPDNSAGRVHDESALNGKNEAPATMIMDEGR